MAVAVGVAMLGGIAFSAASASANGDENHKDKVWVEVTPPVFTAPTCDAAGSVVALETKGYEWDINHGWYMAKAKEGFSLKGKTAFGPYDVHQLRDCKPVTPPVYVAPTCAKDGSITGLETRYYEWKLDRRTGIYTAVPRDHYNLSGTLTFGPAPLERLEACVVTPPVFTAPTCVARGSVVAADTQFYHWVITGTADVPIYTATPNPIIHNGGDFKSHGDQFYKLIKPTVFTFNLVQLVCANTNTTAVTPPVFTPGTCTAAGSVVATETTGYSWVSAGEAAATSYQALAKAGYTLTGTTMFGPFDLSKIPAQSADSAAPCYAPPGTVLGVVKNAPVKAPVVAGVVKSAPVTTLAFTGAETVPLALSGLLALLLGAVLTVASRQRPKKARE